MIGSPATAPRRKGWFPALEGIRGLAALGILLYHMHLETLLLGAGQGVMEVFFVLSGFLITSILVDEFDSHGGIRLIPFYRRRLRRLFPSLAAVVFVVVLIDQFVDVPGSKGAPLPALLYYMNFWEMKAGNNGGILDQTWSLAIEEQFYLLWPLFLLLILRRKDRRERLLLGAALVLLALAARILVVESGADLIRIRNGTDVRAFGFLLGGLASLARQADLPGFWRARLALISSVFLVTVPLGVDAYVGKTFLTWWLWTAVATAVVIWHVAREKVDVIGQALAIRPLRLLGIISYSLYLWHPVTLWGVEAVLVHFAHTIHSGWQVWAYRALGLSASMLVATLSYLCIERVFWRPRGVVVTRAPADAAT